MLGWRFPKLDGGNEQGFNNSGIETFSGSEMYNNLAREICQNSLDAKNEDVDGPVRVDFSVKELHISDYSEITELISVIDGCKAYWKDKMDSKLSNFFKLVDRMQKNESICLLIASDYHTTGLTGSREEKYAKTKWNALTHSDGVSDKGEDSGGSYGIGKNAPYVCSGLRTVFYNTYAVDGEMAFQGTTRLMTHLNEKGEETVGIGLYYEKDKLMPIYAEDECKLRDVINRTEFGTDVIILGFEKEEDWQDSIEKAIVSNFFIAIYENKLVINIDDRVIDSTSIGQIIEKHSKFDQDMLLTKSLYEARISDDSKVFNQFPGYPDGDVELYVRLDDTYQRKIAEFRNSGMTIRIRGKNVSKPYAAVMIVRSLELNKILKAMEPPKHDKWDYKIIVDEVERKKGKRLRDDLIKWTNTVIDEFCRNESTEAIDPDGLSQFLPDDFIEGDNEAPFKSSSIDANQVVRKVKRRKTRVSNLTTSGMTGTGSSEEGSVNNSSSGAQGGVAPAGVGSENGTDKVGRESENNKTVSRPVVLKQRIFQTSNGCYQTSIYLENDCENAYLSINAIGDDGMPEAILIQEYEKDGIKVLSNKNKIGPICLKGKNMEHISLKLEYSEKMRLRLDIQ